MKEFTDILTHARRLNAATKSLTSAELQDVAIKLAGVIEQRKADEEALRAEQAEKLAEVERIRKQIEAAGLRPEDIFGGDTAAATASKPRKKRAPVAPKYAYTDADGQRKTWTGQGRTPKAIQAALDQGKNLDSFKI
ncbi:MAG: H-NS histone family protein [Gammaproteobacteria bacterium]|nr:H-NS histone family protein [Gammaproteobacteria bacterium]